MFSVLLISHGTLASSMLESAKMIQGHGRKAHVIEIDRYTEKENLKKQIKQKIGELSMDGKVVVLTDIPLGTPFNVVVSLMSELDFIHLTGMNLSMVLELLLICEDDISIEEYSIEIMKRAKEKMFHVNEFCENLQLSDEQSFK